MSNTYDKILGAVKSLFPFEGYKNKLILNNIWVEDNNYNINDISAQQDARLTGGSWQVPVYADLTLVDKEGKVIDNNKKIKILDIPHITHRYSYVVEGTEYQVPNQMRLKPGVYVHEKGDGLYRGWYNLATGIEREFGIQLDPQTRRLTIIYGSIKATPLLPFLRGLGISDKDILNAWGEEVYKINDRGDTDTIMFNMSKNISGIESKDRTEQVNNILDKFKESKMDGDINKHNLGTAYDHVTPQSLLDTSKKLLAVVRGDSKQDDRDSLIYKNILSTDDFLEKRIKDSVQRITRKIKNNLNRKDKVKDILTYDIFSIPIKSFFKKTSLSNAAEHSSPLGYISENSKITPLGEGGIESIYQLHDAARAINPSTFGFIDPLYTPDNDRAGAILHLATNAFKDGKDLKINIWNVKLNKLDTMNPTTADESIVGFASEYNIKHTGAGKLVFTPKHKLVSAVKKGDFVKVKPTEVDYIHLNDTQVFALETNLIPFINHTQGNRIQISTKMIHATVGLKEPEAPLVRTSLSKYTSDASYEDFVGILTNQYAPAEGIVKDIKNNEIIIEGKDNKIHKVGLYNNFPLGESGFMTSTPVVKIGDKVTNETMVAHTNYSTKEGSYAYGKNLNVAYLSYKGLNTDDGIVISDAAAKKLTSEHMYKFSVRLDTEIELNSRKFKALYPTAINNEQFNKLDAEGIIKKGAIVEFGDVLIALLKKEPITMEDLLVKKLYKKISNPWKNRSIEYDNHVRGEVVNVVRTKKNIDVYIKTAEKAVIGDKLCCDINTEVLTLSGWKYFKDLKYSDEVCSWNPITQKIQYDAPELITNYYHKDRMYLVEGDELSICVNAEHNMYIKDINTLLNNYANSKDIYKLVMAKDLDKPFWPRESYCYLKKNSAGGLEDIYLNDTYKSEWIDYDNYIYCCTVPTHIMYVRRNGKECWTGNTNRVGSKGVITHIVPTDQMPRTHDDKIADVLFSPTVITTRMNVGQVLESAASKIADKTGKPYMVENFSGGENYMDKIKAELKKYNLKDTEIMFDPNTDKELGELMFGKQYIVKLKQQVSHKMASRSGGAGESYNINRIPKGSEGGGQAIGHLGLYAMLAHGAPANLLEMNTIKSDYNPEYWEALRLGQPLPPPKIPFSYEKFLGYLKVLGVDTVKEGNLLNLTPLMDRDVTKLSRGAVDAVKAIRGKDQKPEKGGIFDEKLTGGLDGNKWTHISLNDSIPNPVFEDAIVSILGITYETFNNIMAGKLGIDDSNKITKDYKYTTSKAFIKLLDNVNVKADLIKYTAMLDKLSGSELAKVRKRVKILRNLDKLNLSPREAYIRKLIPVIPPVFRPIGLLSSGSPTIDDLNYLYKDISLHNDSLETAKKILTKEDVNESYNNLYTAVKNLELSGSMQAGKKYKGVMEIIKGNSPKEGYFQKALVRERKQDVSGRSVIVPNPALGLDEIGLPIKMAWKIYEPFIMKRLVQAGYKPNEAMKMIDDQHPSAFRTLELEVSKRPLKIKRDPVLHKFGIMAVKPKLIAGDAIEINSMINKGLGADYDGDCYFGMISISYNTANKDIAKYFEENLTGLESCDTLKLSLEDITENKINNQLYNSDNKALEVCNMIDGSTKIVVNDKESFFSNKTIHIKDFPKTGKPEIRGNVELYKVPEGIYIHSYNFETKKIERTMITQYSVHKDLKLVTVKTRGNREVIVSDDMSLYCIDEELNLNKITPANAINKLTPRPRILEGKNLTEVPIDAYYRNNKKDVMGKVSNDKLILNYHTGYVLGLFVGEGWGDGKAINFASVIPEVRDYVKEGLSKYFSDDLSFRDYEQRNQDFCEGKYVSHKVVATSTELSSLIMTLNGHRAGNKHLPPFYLDACEDFRLGLLAGLMDGDGTVSKVQAKSKKKPQYMSNYCTISEILADEVSLLLTSLGIKSGITRTKKTNGVGDAFYVTVSLPDTIQYKDKLVLHHPTKLGHMKDMFEIGFDANSSARNDIVPTNGNALNEITKKYISNKGHSNLYVELRKSIDRGYISRAKALETLNILGENIHNIYKGSMWKDIVLNNHIFWDIVEEITPTTGSVAYDFTVPGSYTFMAANSIILQDTVALFAPVSDKAIGEMGAMLPSSNLFSPRDGGIVYYPTQESTLGIYLMTKEGKHVNKKFSNSESVIAALNKGVISITDMIHIGSKLTSAGRELIAKDLPADTKISYPINSKELIKIVTSIAKDHPESYARIVNNLKDHGFKESYDSGFSLSMKDFGMSDKVNKDIENIWVEAEKKIFGRKLTDHEKISIFNDAKEDADKILKSGLELQADKKDDNHLHTLTISGAKGKWGNLAQILGSVGMVQNIFGEAVPYPIKGNFSKGLDIAEYLAHTHGARKGTASKQKEVKDPGYLSKQLVNTMLDTIVISADCNTKRGINMSTEDPESLDRYLSQTVKVGDDIYNHNTLVTPALLATFKKANIKNIVVRSPLRCELPQGVCQKCMGLDETGHEPKMGTHVGIKAAQSIGEPTVQLSLSAFHTGGVAGKQVDPLTRLQQLLLLPKNVKNKATISRYYGKVENIEPSVMGGYDVFIKSESMKSAVKHWVPRGLELKVHKGNDVKKGQVLSAGFIDPRELLELRGPEATQNYLIDEMRDLMSITGATKRKNFELVVRNIGGMGEVTHAGDNNNYLRGDIVPTSKINYYNKSERFKEIEKSKAIGHKLSEDIPGYSKGTVVTKSMLPKIKLNNVPIELSPIEYKPIIKGINVAPLEIIEDWMAKLNFHHIESSLLNSILYGESSNKHGLNPIPAIAEGIDIQKIMERHNRGEKD
jgi:DNA-directed RNA polymerase beta subunit